MSAANESHPPSPCSHFNDLRDREKWARWKNQDGVWKCPECNAVLEDGPNRADPFRGCSVHCGECDAELTRRTGGGQSDPFRWILDANDQAQL
jgi:hypothetical protein